MDHNWVEESVRDVCCILVNLPTSDGKAGIGEHRADTTGLRTVCYHVDIPLNISHQPVTLYLASLVRQTRTTTLPPTLPPSCSRPSFNAADWSRWKSTATLCRHQHWSTASTCCCDDVVISSSERTTADYRPLASLSQSCDNRRDNFLRLDCTCSVLYVSYAVNPLKGRAVSWLHFASQV